MQYTLCDVPPHLDVKLRERARRLSKSLNQVAIEALAQGLGRRRGEHTPPIAGRHCRNLEEGCRPREGDCGSGPRRPQDVAMRVALDTNWCDDLCKGVEETGILET